MFLAAIHLCRNRNAENGNSSWHVSSRNASKHSWFASMHFRAYIIGVPVVGERSHIQFFYSFICIHFVFSTFDRTSEPLFPSFLSRPCQHSMPQKSCPTEHRVQQSLAQYEVECQRILSLATMRPTLSRRFGAGSRSRPNLFRKSSRNLSVLFIPSKANTHRLVTLSSRAKVQCSLLYAYTEDEYPSSYCPVFVDDIPMSVL